MMGKKKKKSLNVGEGSENDGLTEATPVLLEPDDSRPNEMKPWAASQIKDARLIPRIKEYLAARKNKKAAVNVYAIVDYLQSKYQEYGRKKRQMFIQYVERAYAVLKKTEPSLFEGNTCSDGDSSDLEDEDVVLIDYLDTNGMNNMMSSLYKGGTKDGSQTPKVDEKKRKLEKPDSVKKRQRLADSNILNTNTNLPVVQPQGTDKSEDYFIDRKGNTKVGKVINSADNAREIVQTYKSGISSPASDTTTPNQRVGNFGDNAREIIQTYKSGISSPASGTTTPNPKKAWCMSAANSDKDITVPDVEQQGLSSDNVLCRDESSRDSLVMGGLDWQESVEVEPDVTPNKAAALAKPAHASAIKPERAALAAKHEEISTPDIVDTPSKSRREKGTKRVKDGSKTRSRENGEKDNQKKDKGAAVQKSSLTFADVGGNEQNLQEICKLLVHMRHPEVYLRLGVTPPRGFLLHGPPGCGKTLLANAIAGELDLPLIKLAAPEIVSGVSGDSEEKIRDLFEKAVQCSPCVMFIDEIDAITPKRETASKDMERRIVAQLLACMDDLNSNPDAQVLVIGATNRPDSIDPALRRAGRFDREICLGIPDEQSRLRILQVLCRGLRLSEGFDFLYLAKNSPGYVGADLMALTREAAMTAVNRVFQELQTLVKPGEETAMEVDCTDATSLIPAQQGGVQPSDATISGDLTAPSIASDVGSEVKCDNPGDNQTKKEDETKSVGEQCTEDREKETDTDSDYREITIATDDMRTCSGPTEPLSGNVTCNNNTVSSAEPKIGMSEDRAASEIAAGVKCDSLGLSEAVRTSEPAVEIAKEARASANVDVCDASSSIASRAVSEDWVVVELAEDAVAQVGAAEDKLGKKPTELASVLSWLKEQPPLTDAQLADLFITMDDFKEALQYVQPSAKREGFATVPDVTWADIGALHEVREELQLAILAPVRHAEEFRSLGLNRAQGILLAGPPGCGKTLLAKAVANESGINFISVKGPELLNMYVGESEKAVRTVFQRARNSSPCVIFFDELDALCPRRGGSAGDSGSSTRVVNQLLTEMDGLEERKQVFIMAATNRPDIIDPAILRPGRLDKTLYVGLPTKEDRVDIFKCITKDGTKPCLGSDVDLNKLAEDERCERFTGADLAAFVREASVIALKKAITDKGRQPGDTIVVRGEHFEASFKKIRPSVSTKDMDKYRAMEEKMTAVS